MEDSSEILAAIKALQIHIGGQINETNRALKEFMHSMDSHFGELKLRPKTSLHTNLHKFGSKLEDSKAPQLDRPFTLSKAFTSAHFHESRLRNLKLVKTTDGDELEYFELETRAKEVDGELISSALETKDDGSVDKEFECKMGTITSCLVHNETTEEEKLKTMDVKVANDTPLLYSLVDMTMFANEEKDGKGISEVVDFPLKLLQELGEKTNLVVEQLRLGRLYKVHVARRRTTFKLYALKEVYVESLNLHLEDKVVLKGRRVDTTMNIYLFSKLFMLWSLIVVVCFVAEV